MKRKVLLFMLLIVFLVSCTQISKINIGPAQAYWKTSPEWCEQNASICEPNQASADKGIMCKDYCFMKSASDFDNPSTCERIALQSGDISKDRCYINLAKKLNQADLCKNVEKEESFNSKDECLQKIAVIRDDVSFCESIKRQSHDGTSSREFFPFSKDACFFSLAFNTNNLQLCEKISDQAFGIGRTFAHNSKIRFGSKNACKVWFAAKNNDISICKSIQTDAFNDPDACIIAVAVFNNKPKICENVVGNTIASASKLKQHSKDHCYYKIARTYYNVDLCNELDDEGVLYIYDNIGGEIQGQKWFKKQECIDSVENSLKLGKQKGIRDEEVLFSNMW